MHVGGDGGQASQARSGSLGRKISTTRRSVAWSLGTRRARFRDPGQCRTDTNQQRGRLVSRVSRPQMPPYLIERRVWVHSHGCMPHRDIRDQKEDMNVPNAFNPTPPHSRYLTRLLPHSSVASLRSCSGPPFLVATSSSWVHSPSSGSSSSIVRPRSPQVALEISIFSLSCLPHYLLTRSLATLAEINSKCMPSVHEGCSWRESVLLIKVYV